MKKLLNKTGASRPAPEIKPAALIPTPTRTTTSGNPGTWDDNQRRASEVGPVLEEILQARWNHWEIKY